MSGARPAGLRPTTHRASFLAACVAIALAGCRNDAAPMCPVASGASATCEVACARMFEIECQVEADEASCVARCVTATSELNADVRDRVLACYAAAADCDAIDGCSRGCGPSGGAVPFPGIALDAAVDDGGRLDDAGGEDRVDSGLSVEAGADDAEIDDAAVNDAAVDDAAVDDAGIDDAAIRDAASDAGATNDADVVDDGGGASDGGSAGDASTSDGSTPNDGASAARDAGALDQDGAVAGVTPVGDAASRAARVGPRRHASSTAEMEPRKTLVRSTSRALRRRFEGRYA